MAKNELSFGQPSFLFLFLVLVVFKIQYSQTGETDTKYKSLRLTTHPKDNIAHFPLNKNPNSKDNKISYVQNKVLTSRKDYLEKKFFDWEFSKEDIPIIRHIIKDYEKRIKRKSKKGHKKR